MEVKILPEGYLLAVYLGFFLALGACLGMVAFELVRRGLQTLLVSLTAMTSAVASWGKGPTFTRKGDKK